MQDSFFNGASDILHFSGLLAANLGLNPGIVAIIPRESKKGKRELANPGLNPGFAANHSRGQMDCTVFVLFLLTMIRDTLRELQANQSRHVGGNGGGNGGRNVGGNEEAVLTILRKRPASTTKALAELTNLSMRQIERILKNLKEQRRIVRHGVTKNGYWEVMDIKS